jgi:surface protein
MDLSYVTLNLGEATAAVTDWSSVVNAGITKVKMVGAWNSSYRHSFSAITYTDNAKITSIDLSGVTGLDNSNLPSYFCQVCSNLSEVKLPNDLKVVNSNMFQYCSNLKEIDIPSSVTSIGDYAFYGCSSLESIELPQGLETIYSYAFRNCSSLKKVVCKATTPPKLREAIFDYTPDDKVLYVPDDCVETYKTADAATSRFVIYVAWKDVFGDNIKPISEMPEDE